MKKNLPRFIRFNLNLMKLSSVLTVLFLMSGIGTVMAQSSNAMNFDGAGDYAAINGTLITTESYTKEAWIRIADASGPGTNARNIISETNSGLYVYDDSTLAASQNPSWTARVKDNTPLTVGVWYHVAVVYDKANNKMTLYKNGVQVDQTTVNTIGVATPSTIGAIYFGGAYGYYFWGDIAEVRVWNYARTTSEIALTYNCGIPDNTPGMLAYFRFDEGVADGDNTSVDSLTDLSGNNHNAGLHGFALDGSGSNFIDDFTEVTGECTVMPVTLKGFLAKAEGSSVLLSWQTATEFNNQGFSVERSADGNNNWEQVAFIDGKGNSAITQYYQYRDMNPLSGKCFYRLKQTDLDGKAAYSRVVSVDVSALPGVHLYPSLASTTITLNISDRSVLNTPFVIFDNSGRVVRKGTIQSAIQAIDISQLQNGAYFLKIQNYDGFRFVKN